jgi:hypothetical protein
LIFISILGFSLNNLGYKALFKAAPNFLGQPFLGRCKDVRTTKVKKNIKKNARKFGNIPKKLYLCLLNVLYSSKGWF